MKKAIITGVLGQDGAYLAKLLLEKGYKVYGGFRRSSSQNFWRLDFLDLLNDNNLTLFNMDVSDPMSVINAVKDIRPDEIYNLAAQSFVEVSFSEPITTTSTNSLGPCNILHAIKNEKDDTKFYQASTSEMFGLIQQPIQSESTPFYPRSPYGVAKLYGHFITINYRESYNLFASNGILFNHESPLRGSEFVTRKITQGIARLTQDQSFVLKLGNLNAKRDWGFAGDYVEGMYLMLQADSPDNFVLSTGKTYTVREFLHLCLAYADITFESVGEGINEKIIDTKTGREIVRVDSQFFRPAEVDVLIGDSTKAKNILNWQSATSIDQLVKLMVDADLERITH